MSRDPKILPRLLWITVFLAGSSSKIYSATLRHHWSFNEGSGGTLGDSVGTSSMGIQGATNGWIDGKNGKAFNFTGSNYALTLAKDTVVDPGNGGAVAIAGWFKTSSTDNRMFLFQMETLYEMRMSQGQLKVSFRGNSSNVPLWGSDLNDGLWHHFVAQNQNGLTELWIDGFLAGSFPESPLSLNSTSKHSALGALQNGNSPFVGALDEVRYYLGALTSYEIQVLAGIAARPPTAVADAYSGTMNTSLIVTAPGVLANDYELDGDSLTAQLVTAPSSGSLIFNPNGSFTYIPVTNVSGTITFTYVARDKDGDSLPATVTLSLLDPASSITPAEASQIENDLGLTLTEQEKTDLASIVKPPTTAAWRSAANQRIEAIRRADLNITVVDSQGNPVPGASVQATLRRNRFNFGGVVDVNDLTDANGSLATAGSTSTQWIQLVKALFNSVGLNNGLKPKITSQHASLPGFFGWASAQGLPVRGHLLLWPGTGTVETLDNPNAVAGTDFGNHLSTNTFSTYKSQNVLGAVETYRNSPRTQSDKDALATVVNSEIAEWAGRWNVYEWDVLNESLSNTLLQEIFGVNCMAGWFQTAAAHRMNSACQLLINDYQIISASFSSGSTTYLTRRNAYFANIDQILADGGPLSGIGFQSRFKFLDGYAPEAVYSRLEEFATRYPQLSLRGTEFEIPDNYSYSTGNLVQAYDETTRARVTEEVITTYFSHPKVEGLNAWDFMNPPPDGTANAYSRSLCYYGDGPGGKNGPLVKLNGLVWYYLHRIRYFTSTNGTTDSLGRVTLRGYQGDYHLTVQYGGRSYPATTALVTNQSLAIPLTDVALLSPFRTIDRWDFNDAAGVRLASTMKTEGATVFSVTNTNIATDGTGALLITRHPTATANSAGDYLTSSAIFIGSRTTGQYELEFRIRAAQLSQGSASGALVGLGMRDSSVAKDLFLIRLNKTTNGLVLSTYIDATYRQIHSWPGVYVLPQPVTVRTEVDLGAKTGSIYLQEGTGTEIFKQSVPLSTNAITWDRLSWNAVNNQTQWGAGDRVEIDFLQTRRLNADNFSAWSQRVNWSGQSARSESADPDQDGIPNLLEFVLGGNPVSADLPLRFPQIVMTNQIPMIEFPLGIDSLDHEIYLEYSSDLQDWTSIPRSRVQGQAGITFRTNLPTNGLNRMFSRITIGP